MTASRVARELADLLLQRGDARRAGVMVDGRHVTSRETWSERAPWVSAPIEMKSTPVSAYARTLPRVMPPEASSSARPCDELDGARDLGRASCCRAGSARRPRRAPAATWSSVSASTSIGRSRARGADRRERGLDAARDAHVVVLDQDRVVETHAVVRAAAAADGVLLERAQAGRRLAGVEDRRAGAGDEVDVAARSASRCRTGARAG